MTQDFDNPLVAQAIKAAETAYCKYSNFSVGAAITTQDGEVFDGCNVENASYGLTICAERVAIFKAVSAGHTKLSAIAVHCPPSKTNDPDQRMPCGACRQVMAEFMSPESSVYVDGVGTFALRELLPNAFHF